MTTAMRVQGVVQQGETFREFCARYGATPCAVMAANPVLRGQQRPGGVELFIGQVLSVPMSFGGGLTRASAFEVDTETQPEVPEALKQRQNDCIAAGGVFFAPSNQCCDPNFLAYEEDWKPGKSCGDPLAVKEAQDQAKKNSAWVPWAIGAGVVLVAGGLVWGATHMTPSKADERVAA